MPDLETTNVLLGIMAAVAVLEGLVLIGLGIGGFMVYRRVMTVVNEIEEKRIAPIAAKVNAILEDVRGVTARVEAQAARVDHAINGTMERVDDTASRVRHTVRERIDQVVGVAHAVRATIASLFGRRVPNY
jgi:pyrimidine operon attenuation protein/uracil phosphoribosyltransferase